MPLPLWTPSAPKGQSGPFGFPDPRGPLLPGRQLGFASIRLARRMARVAALHETRPPSGSPTSLRVCRFLSGTGTRRRPERCGYISAVLRPKGASRRMRNGFCHNSHDQRPQVRIRLHIPRPSRRRHRLLLRTSGSHFPQQRRGVQGDEFNLALARALVPPGARVSRGFPHWNPLARWGHGAAGSGPVKQLQTAVCKQTKTVGDESAKRN
jgi:hypothetical protein